jgi:hypothetical protein
VLYLAMTEFSLLHESVHKGSIKLRKYCINIMVNCKKSRSVYARMYMRAYVRVCVCVAYDTLRLYIYI